MYTWNGQRFPTLEAAQAAFAARLALDVPGGDPLTKVSSILQNPGHLDTVVRNLFVGTAGADLRMDMTELAKMIPMLGQVVLLPNLQVHPSLCSQFDTNRDGCFDLEECKHFTWQVLSHVHHDLSKQYRPSTGGYGAAADGSKYPRWHVEDVTQGVDHPPGARIERYTDYPPHEAQANRVFMVIVGSNYDTVSCAAVPGWKTNQRVSAEYMLEIAKSSRAFYETCFGLEHNSLDFTKEGIEEAIRRQGSKMHQMGCGRGDFFVFHFSGHGEQLPDQDGDESKNGRCGHDEAFCVFDPATRKPTLKGQFPTSWLRDDDLVTMITTHVPPMVTFIGIADCCHSAGAFDLEKDAYNKFSGAVTISGCKSKEKSHGHAMNDWFHSGSYLTQTLHAAFQTMQQQKGVGAGFMFGELWNAMQDKFTEYEASLKQQNRKQTLSLKRKNIDLKRTPWPLVPQTSCVPKSLTGSPAPGVVAYSSPDPDCDN